MGRKPKEAKESGLHSGNRVIIYLDKHLDERPLAKVKLIKKLSKAKNIDSFITEDMSALNQEVWSFEKWKVEILDVTDLGKRYHYKPGDVITYDIKVLFNIGITPSGVTNLQEVSGFYEDRNSSFLIDNFEGVPGWGQQF